MVVGHAMVQKVGCIPLTMEVCVQTRATPRGIDVDKVKLRKVLLLVLWFFPVIVIPPVPQAVNFSFTGTM